MLTLQRASAGSGKTYTLTKKFLRLLISIKDEGATRPRLRDDNELRDSVSHILAITFTNKATDEMKQRIMAKLNDLAYNVDPANPGATTYMQDFMDEFSATPDEISRSCGIALRYLLYCYSDFNVMTIDSFFQAILRTFAYEADLPDGYEVIINTGAVNREVVLRMIDDLTGGNLDKVTESWVRHYIEERIRTGKKGWNVFDQKISADANPRSSTLLDEFRKLADEFDKEENKIPRARLTEYFDNGGDLLKALDEGGRLFDDELTDRFARVNEAANNVIDEAAAMSSEPMKDYIAYGHLLPGQLAKFASSTADPADDLKLSGPKEWTEKNLWKGKDADKKKMLGIYAERCHSLVEALNKLRQAFDEWSEWKASANNQLWQLLKKSVPRIGLMRELHKRGEQFLVESGTMKLSDTNTILRRIIADDDVPFIYERHGSRFHHFLIDEFQDTSRMQWDNMVPLLRESESHDNENLIIGDAKQSIYRFRSADPTLITGRVPDEFPGLDMRGHAKAENTNHRSLRRIVKFNNFFFRHLTDLLGGGLENLYANTVQFPAKKEEKGYVCVEFYAENREKKESDVVDRLSETLLESIYHRINNLLSRGYLQKEIAILTNSNAAAGEIISYLSDRSMTDDDESLQKLSFVGEDSLKLGVSKAVQTVVECLRMIQNGMEGKFADSEDDDKSIRTNWLPLAAHFRYYCMSHRDEDMQERIENFLSGDFDGDVMSELLAGMQAVTLPSLVEALTEIFVADELKRNDAIYLAAFQDEVLAYCEVWPSDIGSFLRWWDKAGCNVAVISPEGSDAISVMTIHKSKGLEFPCVLLPELDFSLEMKDEWTWVEIPEDFPLAEYLPSMMPILISKSETKWKNTPFESIRSEAVKNVRADQLNKAYVAMTRPICELYIWQAGLPADDDVVESEEETKSRKKGVASSEAAKKSMGVAIKEIIGRYDEYSAKNRPDEMEMMPSDEEMKIGPAAYEYGMPIQDVASTLKRYREEKQSASEDRQISEYFVNSNRPILQYTPEKDQLYEDPAEDDRQDPRSVGSLLHGVLEYVREASDLRKGFEKMRVKGRISRDEIEYYYPLLEKALMSVEDYGWFDGSRKVLNERPLIQAGSRTRRPDRVLVNKDGSMTVIDYKFGTSNRSAYRSQVRNYMRKLREYAGAPHVEGYLWYIKEGEVEQVYL
ncbi:MAG: UvrD-helicase domain-containing protein [Muribaculaceae bacterium]|nr:UvrD-helicase domain-containing protein [Muribaculaceae bacterium]